MTTALAPQHPIYDVLSPLIEEATSYQAMNCWDLVRHLYEQGLGLELQWAHHQAAQEFVELWYREHDTLDAMCPQKLPRPWDLCLFEIGHHSEPHVGIICPGGYIAHSTGQHGVHLAPLSRYRHHLYQLSRPHILFREPLPPVPPNPPPDRDWEHVFLRCVRSPIVGQDGNAREMRTIHEPGQPLRAILPTRREPMRVWRNGLELQPETWDACMLAPGDDVQVSSFWGSFIPLPILLIGAQLLLAAGSLALSTYLSQPKNTSGDEDEERTQTYAGIRNNNRPGGVVESYYGRGRVGPTRGGLSVQYAANYIEDAGAPQPTEVQVVDAVGGYVPSDSPDDPDISNPLIVEVASDTIWDKDDVLEFRPADPAASTRGSYRVRLRISARRFELVAPFQARAADFLNGYFTQKVTQSNEATAVNASVNWLGFLGEGPLTAIHTDTIEIQGQPIDNFPEVRIQTRLGEPDQPPFDGLDDTRKSYAVGATITPSPAVSYTTTVPVNGFSFNIDFNDGLIFFDDEGDRFVQTVYYEYRWRVQGGTYTAWIPVDFWGYNQAPVRIALTQVGLPLNYYQAQIRFINAISEDPTLARFEGTLTSVTEIVSSVESYGGTAALRLENIPADKIPGGNVDNITVIIDGIRVRVGSFSARPAGSSNPAWICMDVLTRKFGNPDSTINLPAFQAWADNNDIARPTLDMGDQNPARPRVGLPPRDMIDRRMDLKHNHTAFLAIQQPAREQTVINELTELSRCVMLDSAGQWSPVVLKPDVPAQSFSSANVLNLTVTSMLDEERITVIQSSSNDATNNYERTTKSWPPEDQWDTLDEINILSRDQRGVTEPDEIQRNDQYELNRRQLPHDQITFETTEAPTLNREELFWFSHEQQGWGDAGRATGGESDGIGLAHPVNYQAANAPYEILVRHQDGTQDIRTVVSPGPDGDYDYLFVTADFTYTPVADTVTWQYGRTGPPRTTALMFRCKDVRFQQSSMRFKVTALEHIPEVYTDPQPEPPATITTLPGVEDPPPGIREVKAETLERIGPDGNTRFTVGLSWTLEEPVTNVSPNLAGYAGAQIRRRIVRSAGTLNAGVLDQIQLDTPITADEAGVVDNFVLIGEVRQGNTSFEDTSVTPGGTYVYMIIPLSRLLVHGPPGYVTHHVLPIRTSQLPGTPTNLRLEGLAVGVTEFDGPDAVFAWDAPILSGVDRRTARVKDYCVEIWGTNSSENFAFKLHPPLGGPSEACTVDTRFRYERRLNQVDSQTAGLPDAQRKITIRVWARSAEGYRSAEPAILTVENPPPDMSAVALTGVQLSRGFSVRWKTFVAPNDIDRYQVDISLPGAAPGSTLQDVVSGQADSYVASDLDGDIIYEVRVTPYDTFGIGVPTGLFSQRTSAPADQWQFFAANVVSTVTFTPVGDRVDWTAGTIEYTDTSGVRQTDSVSAGTATRGLPQSLFIYHQFGGTALRSTQSTTEAFGQTDFIRLFVFNGGTSFEDLGGGKISGSAIFNETVGANQLVATEAVITNQVQMGAATVGEIAIVDETITGAKLVQTEVIIAQTAQLENLIVGTEKITNQAVTSEAQDTDLTGATYAANTGKYYPLNDITFDLTDAAYVYVWGYTSARCASQQFVDVRVERTGIGEVGRGTAGNQMTATGISGFLEFQVWAVDFEDTSGLSGNHTYRFSVEPQAGAPGNITFPNLKFGVQVFKK